MKLNQMNEQQLKKVIKESRKELSKRKRVQARLNEEVDEIYAGAENADERFHSKLNDFKRQMTRLLNNTVEDIREETIHDRPASRMEIEEKFRFLAERASNIYRDIFGR